MTSRGPNWDIVISDLARHLASVADAAQVERILRDADRDLFHLRPPSNFWSRVRACYDRRFEARATTAAPSRMVRRLLAVRSLAERAPAE
jgi:hypothetical protein